MGILQREVIYFQFDYDEIYKGAHSSKKGYFDYQRDGFGPVCYKEKEVLDALERFLDRGGKATPEYLKRMQDFYAFHDTNNCQRAFEAIESLEKPSFYK